MSNQKNFFLELSTIVSTLGLAIENEATALLDVTPMQGGTNDPDEEFLPVFAINFRSSPPSNIDPKKAESAFNGELVDLRRAIFLVKEQTSLHMLAKVHNA